MDFFQNNYLMSRSAWILTELDENCEFIYLHILWLLFPSLWIFHEITIDIIFPNWLGSTWLMIFSPPQLFLRESCKTTKVFLISIPPPSFPLSFSWGVLFCWDTNGSFRLCSFEKVATEGTVILGKRMMLGPPFVNSPFARMIIDRHFSRH